MESPLNNKIKYWVELSDYDLETAKAMERTRRYLYVGFMCHQVVEKIFKAYFIKVSETMPPFSHSLSYLAEKGNFFSHFNELQINFIDSIEPLNIETRYPSHKDKLLKSLTPKKCKELIEETSEFQSWIKERL